MDEEKLHTHNSVCAKSAQVVLIFFKIILVFFIRFGFNANFVRQF